MLLHPKTRPRLANVSNNHISRHVEFKTAAMDLARRECCRPRFWGHPGATYAATWCSNTEQPGADTFWRQQVQHL